MKLNYNVTGAQRKSLVAAVSQHLNTPAKYLGMPSAAYEIGGYTVTKTGELIGADNLDLEDALHQQGFNAEEREYDEADTYESGLGGMGATEIIDLRTYETADNDVESGTLSIEIPLKGFNETALDNLGKLIGSKAELIKKALDVDALPVEKGEHKLRFGWFPYTEDPEKVNAYAQFISLLCDTAKSKNRVTAKACSTENMKFTMRVWLISLGMVGDDYKTARKILLRNLPGNSSFSKGKRPVYTANCYTYPNGSEEDAMDCDSRDFPSLAKAKAHCDEFLADCESVKFAGTHIEDGDGNYVYTILSDGTVEIK